MSGLLVLGAGGKTAAAGFQPTDIAGLKLWLKADAITGLNDGDAVGTWADSSGNSNDVTQATAGLKPLYKTSILNGQPVVRFDGTDDYLAKASFSTGGSAGSLFVVFRILSAVNHYSVVELQTYDTYWRYSSDALGYWGNFCTARINGYPAAMPSSGNHLLSNVAGANQEIWLDGVSKGTSSYTFADASTLQVGRQSNLSKYLNGDVAEVLVYNSALSTTDRQSVETYLNGKYAIY